MKMSSAGFITRILFTSNNCKTLIKQLPAKPINLTQINRFLRSTVKQNFIQSESKINAVTVKPRTLRSYFGLFNRQNQQSLANSRSNQTAATKPPTPSEGATAGTAAAGGSLSIFRRFKDAYKKHGTILIVCHVTLCFGWIFGFYLLAESGFDIKNLFNVLESFHIMSHETSEGIIKKIETFDLEKFLRSYHFDYVLSDSNLEWIGKSITGITLKHMIVAVMLYKIFTPLRYVATLATTKVVIDVGRRFGFIQTQKGLAKELAKEQREVVGRYIKNKGDRLARRSRYALSRLNRKASTTTTTTKPPPTNPPTQV